jgi:type I restriction enzyme S subunit
MYSRNWDMRSSFKRIGDYVQQTNARNIDLIVTNLQGVSINKQFMPSVANVNGTDLSIYKVVAKGQFAFNPMHVGRDEILPIAMLDTDEPVIVSPAYAVFEIIDKQVLLPEYLMMWCRRPEFDRNAWFTTDSSVRGGFSWDDFCEMTLPVPSPEKQRELVKEYHTIVDRIKLNEQLNQKLEETAQTIYKQWFVDFEFPISAEYAAAIGKPELEGQSYKSNGGEMVYNVVLKQEIPKEWRTSSIGTYSTVRSGFAFKSEWWKSEGVPVIKIGSIQNNTISEDDLDYVDFDKIAVAKKTVVTEGGIVIAMTGATIGKVALVPATYEMFLVNQRVGLFDLGKQPVIKAPYLYVTLKQQYVQDKIGNIGGDSAQANISHDQIQDIFILDATESMTCNYNTVAAPLFRLMSKKHLEINRLKKMSGILLSRLSVEEV